MEWKPKQGPSNGDTRTRTFFAWFPVYIFDERTYVWWERVTVCEEYFSAQYGASAVWSARRRVRDDDPQPA